MPETITIAHLSDVHLPPVAGFTPRHWNVKRTLGWLNWQRKRRFIHCRAALDAIVADAKAQRPDHILVSGDLINIGLPAEYEAALEWLGTVGPPDRVSVVPGNHDIYVRMASDPGVARWTPYMTGEGTSGEHAFPYVRRIGGVAIVGLNSSVPTPVGFARGLLGRPQLDRLGATLEALAGEGLVRLVMIHHPPLPGLAPRRRALVDADALEAVLRRRGAELVVFGHNHRNIRVMSGGIPVVGVASASAARAYRDEPAGCYNLIRVTPRDGHAGPAAIAIETRGIVDGALRIGPIE